MTTFYQIEENVNDYNFETHTYNSYELVNYGPGKYDFEILGVGTLKEMNDLLATMEKGNKQ